ncbi:hypothetical protein AVEN_206023-1 [Araneus ventricosus]|uniref:Uncharacterized protein n=1 Tax=Araneus ventricosus TaxID=182803 RepID=A0A4Y2H3G7_ARAVE|nr:hypothetical protein AVEN_206023-1 [Araneus ventricosus]
MEGDSCRRPRKTGLAVLLPMQAHNTVPARLLVLLSLLMLILPSKPTVSVDEQEITAEVILIYILTRTNYYIYKGKMMNRINLNPREALLPFKDENDYG